MQWQGGVSGSRTINDKNELVGIHFADWTGNDVGMSFAFKSERYLFSNIKNYYLPEYDLIYGGGADQKYSYRDALIKNKPNIKTFLFPNGVKKI